MHSKRPEPSEVRPSAVYPRGEAIPRPGQSGGRLGWKRWKAGCCFQAPSPSPPRRGPPPNPYRPVEAARRTAAGGRRSGFGTGKLALAPRAPHPDLCVESNVQQWFDAPFLSTARWGSGTSWLQKPSYWGGMLSHYFWFWGHKCGSVSLYTSLKYQPRLGSAVYSDSVAIKPGIRLGKQTTYRAPYPYRAKTQRFMMHSQYVLTVFTLGQETAAERRMRWGRPGSRAMRASLPCRPPRSTTGALRILNFPGALGLQPGPKMLWIVLEWGSIGFDWSTDCAGNA